MKLAIIGSGPSAVYVLKHFLKYISVLGGHMREISIFEQDDILGAGMPYNPHTTDDCNLSNIASEELPELVEPFVEWLRRQNDGFLDKAGIVREKINEAGIYSRLALGQYMQAQYRAVVAGIEEAGVKVSEYPRTRVVDIVYEEHKERCVIYTEYGSTYTCGKVVIATGHVWDNSDEQQRRYYKSPWPIHKLLPADGETYSFAVGTLGSSLSAIDVVSSISRRHGQFMTAGDGSMSYHAAPGTEKFKIIMHDLHGWLPNVQYEQREPLRKIYRHVDRETLLALIDEAGFLHLDDYFDHVCRPALKRAFIHDKVAEMVECLDDASFTLSDFIEKMGRKHSYTNAFEGLREELKEAKKSVYGNKPIRWKEVLDDLMYTLNYHAELLPAEDHLRFHGTVAPFLMNVIAAMPLCSAQMLLALHDAQKLDLVAGKVEPLEQEKGETTVVQVTNGEEKVSYEYALFINCGGQKIVEYEAYPFQSLTREGVIQPAHAQFANPGMTESLQEQGEKKIFSDKGTFYLTLSGIDVDAIYRVMGLSGTPNPCIHDISFTHTSGIRPYSYGLQSCSATALIMVQSWVCSLEDGVTMKGDIKEVSALYAQNPVL